MLPLRSRRVAVDSALCLALLTTSVPASALTCFPPPLHYQVMTAGGVFEATVAARRPLDPLLFRVLEWLGHPVMNLADRFELSLRDVESLLGSTPTTIRTGYSYLEPGRRYLFIARQRLVGPLIVGPCIGQAVEASEATALKAWILSLSQPPAGGRLFGIVHAARNARVTARGPIVVETTTDDRGQFGFTGLPDGLYEVSAASRNPSGRLSVSTTEKAWLAGDHDAASVYLLFMPHLSAAERH